MVHEVLGIFAGVSGVTQGDDLVTLLSEGLSFGQASKIQNVGCGDRIPAWTIVRHGVRLEGGGE